MFFWSPLTFIDDVPARIPFRVPWTNLPCWRLKLNWLFSHLRINRPWRCSWFRPCVINEWWSSCRLWTCCLDTGVETPPCRANGPFSWSLFIRQKVIFCHPPFSVCKIVVVEKGLSGIQCWCCTVPLQEPASHTNCLLKHESRPCWPGSGSWLVPSLRPQHKNSLCTREWTHYHPRNAKIPAHFSDCLWHSSGSQAVADSGCTQVVSVSACTTEVGYLAVSLGLQMVANLFWGRAQLRFKTKESYLVLAFPVFNLLWLSWGSLELRHASVRISSPIECFIRIQIQTKGPHWQCPFGDARKLVLKRKQPFVPVWNLPHPKEEKASSSARLVAAPVEGGGCHGPPPAKDQIGKQGAPRCEKNVIKMW